MSTHPTFSISALARASGLDRRTVASRLDMAGVKPAGISAGHPTYPLGQSWRALLKDMAEVSAQEKLSAELAAEAGLDAEIAESKLTIRLAGLVECDEAEAQGAILIDRLAELCQRVLDGFVAAKLPPQAIERATELIDLQIEALLARRGRLFEHVTGNPDA